jgi:hypothetical protein
MAISEKYTVIKTEDWHRLLMALSEQGHSHMAGEPLVNLPIEHEYFVVRQQDVFAPAGLYAYAANVRTTVEAIGVLGLSLMSDNTRDQLLDFADALVETAARWSDEHERRKIPVHIPG